MLCGIDSAKSTFLNCQAQSYNAEVSFFQHANIPNSPMPANDKGASGGFGGSSFFSDFFAEAGDGVVWSSPFLG